MKPYSIYARKLPVARILKNSKWSGWIVHNESTSTNHVPHLKYVVQILRLDSKYDPDCLVQNGMSNKYPQTRITPHWVSFANLDTIYLSFPFNTLHGQWNDIL